MSRAKTEQHVSRTAQNKRELKLNSPSSAKKHYFTLDAFLYGCTITRISNSLDGSSIKQRHIGDGCELLMVTNVQFEGRFVNGLVEARETLTS